MIVFDDFFNTDVQFPETTLLLNIETTGLSPRNSFIYMIGMGWQEHGSLKTRCLLAGSRMDERKLMETFHETVLHFNRVLTFGGLSFSRRFMENRWTNYGDDGEILFDGVILDDIQKDITPYKAALYLTDVKKNSVEKFLKFHRKSSVSGKELISDYAEWERNHDDGICSLLLKHHREDMLSLLCLCNLSAYTTFWNGIFKQIVSWRLEGSLCRFRLLLQSPVPQPVHYKTEHCIITLNSNEAFIDIAVYKGRLKYFLPGPVKDYYYLPTEDQAIHRSIACYVDKAHRQKATAATCYINIDGTFLPTGSRQVHPHFQADYQSPNFHILYDPENWQNNPDVLDLYLASCIKELPQ